MDILQMFSAIMLLIFVIMEIVSFICNYGKKCLNNDCNSLLKFRRRPGHIKTRETK